MTRYCAIIVHRLTGRVVDRCLIWAWNPHHADQHARAILRNWGAAYRLLSLEEI